jgi:hypothetical protein
MSTLALDWSVTQDSQAQRYVSEQLASHSAL